MESLYSTQKKLEPLSILPDHQDPHHPHFPGNLESQAQNHTRYKYAPCMSKWALFGTFGVVGFVVIFAAAVIGSMKFGRDHPPTFGLQGSPFINTSSSRSLEMHTVQVTVATTLTAGPVVIDVPTPVTNTVWITPTTQSSTIIVTTIPMEAPLRPISGSRSPSTIPQPGPSPSSSPSKTCIEQGLFSSKGECEEHCGPEDRKTKECGWRIQWRCIVCDNENAGTQ